ncbi:hypothetical protein ACFVH4_08825 [Nocardia ignorata]|uniref:hypothetical protein n=1 Tax=Nocardia ignorata TaxID=145285 RepID=UPI00363BDB18
MGAGLSPVLIECASRPTATLREPAAPTLRVAAAAVGCRRYCHSDVAIPPTVSATTTTQSHQGPPPVAKLTATAKAVATIAAPATGATTGTSEFDPELIATSPDASNQWRRNLLGHRALRINDSTLVARAPRFFADVPHAS